MKDCLPCVGLHNAAGEDIEEEGAAETTQSTQSTALFLIPSSCIWGGGRESEGEVEPNKKGEVEGRYFKVWLSFSLPYSELIGKELN